jgi:predicted TIM-barrel enzyme
MSTFSRAEILQALAETVGRRVPILAAGSSCGLVAKCAAEAGADLIVVYSTGRSRLMGLPTSRIGDSNASTLEMADEITNVVSTVPIIGGVEAWDPVRLDLGQLLDRFRAAGFSGVINYPTIATMGETWRDRRERVGLGFTREVELIRLARRHDLFTMAYVATAEDAEQMARAGVDCLVPHVGATGGGLAGHETSETRESQVAGLEKMIAAAAGVRDDLIYLAHGGKLSEPKDLDTVYAQTRCVGFVGASSIERIPIERAVMDVVTQFKTAPPRWNGEAAAVSAPWLPVGVRVEGGDQE